MAIASRRRRATRYLRVEVDDALSVSEQVEAVS
jgi:hypothetical protein